MSFVHKYNVSADRQLSPLELELICFRKNWPSEKGGLGAFRHCRNAINMIWPKIQWHSWLEWRVESLCTNTMNAWTGCATAGKTFDASLFAMTWWLVDPMNSAVILTSTTGKSIRRRLWPVIQRLYWDCPGFPGNLVDSKTCLQATRGDDMHGIFALPVKDGNTSRAVADIQGFHPPRLMVIVDEGTDAPEAVFEAIPNLRKGSQDFRFLILGNAANKLDPHGLICAPKNGWSSISVEHDEWETEGVKKWEIDSGVCLHFDGTKSPNIKEGETKYSFLISKEDVERARRSKDGEETIGFWKYTRGFWAPEGICRTIFSENLVLKFDGMGKFTFYSKAFPIAALDPAFGGDRCILRFMEIGDVDYTGKRGVQLGREVEIALKATSSEPIHYQIAQTVIAECGKEGVKPEHFAMDASGEGGGLADILCKEWSSRINRVEFGGMPSDMPVSDDDPTPAKEKYDRKVTELWYSARQFLMAGLLRGLTREDVIEACSREYNDEKRKIKIDTKDECRAKLGKSPDKFDAIVVGLELARRLGVSKNEQEALGGNSAWLKKAQELDSVYIQEQSQEFNAFNF